MIRARSGRGRQLHSWWGREEPGGRPRTAHEVGGRGADPALATELPAACCRCPSSPCHRHGHAAELLRSRRRELSDPAAWAEKAVPFLLGLGPKDNGKPLEGREEGGGHASGWLATKALQWPIIEAKIRSLFPSDKARRTFCGRKTQKNTVAACIALSGHAAASCALLSQPAGQYRAVTPKASSSPNRSQQDSIPATTSAPLHRAGPNPTEVRPVR